MPPDTIYIPGQTDPPPPAGNYFTDSVVQQYWQEDSPASKKKGPHYIFPEWQMFLFVFVVVFASAYFYIIRPDIANRRRKRKLYIGKEEGKLLIEIKYDNWLNKYNPYYHSLNGDLKKRFLHRVQHYLVAKEFHYHAMQEEEYIPVLISGAAVQLTFGLKNYLMDYFDTIHVIKTQYELKNHEMYDGHVSRNGIYISWNNFMRGYDDYADCRNVGLHEMAHAISYDVFLGQQDHHDKEFKKRLENFSDKGKPVFRALRSGSSRFLDDYATTNFDEFWAVCIETFFEDTENFQRTEPELYLSVCELLNQDPLSARKIIDPELAGIIV